MNRKQQPEVEYPCRWQYKVIGTDGEAVAEAARECVARCLGADHGARSVELEPSRSSAGGKYVSWSLSLRVDSARERDELFAALGSHEMIRIVI